MTGTLTGKIACVTGGASGIGRAAALAFAREGAKVVIADMAEEGGRKTAAAISDGGGDAVFLHMDVSRSADVQAMVRLAVERYGRLDCGFNNAGIGGANAPLAEYPEAEFDRVLRTNLKGVFLCMQHELPQMLEQGGGVIVNTASISSFIGGAETPAYSASKAAVGSLTRSAARAYAAKGVRINAVCPGATDTPLPFRRGLPAAQVRQNLSARVPMGRMAQPEEIAEAVIWLCSPAASYVNGHLMVVDGGLLA